MSVKSVIKLNRSAIRQLDNASIRALEKTAEALHQEVVQAQVMPRDTGTLQNEKTFVDMSESYTGYVDIVSEGPYARRLYYHPEYDFQHKENPYAGGKWFNKWLPGGEQEDFVHKTYKHMLKQEADI
jgi:hypothetical protein